MAGSTRPTAVHPGERPGRGPFGPGAFSPAARKEVQAINDFILAAAGQPWVLVLVFACCVIDGFFPPIPSESVVVGLAAVAATADVPDPCS